MSCKPFACPSLPAPFAQPLSLFKTCSIPLTPDPPPKNAPDAGEVLFGTDSHTCNAGAFGQFATGVGNTDAGFILGTGKLLIKVPPTMRFQMDGQMPPWLLAKDLILHVIGEISVAGATYKAMDFCGEAVSGKRRARSVWGVERGMVSE